MIIFEMIQKMTATPDENLSLNLEKQRVVVPGTKGRTKILDRTIYRVRIDGNALIGNIFRKADPKNTWPLYQFDAKDRLWKEIARRTANNPYTPGATYVGTERC